MTRPSSSRPPRVLAFAITISSGHRRAAEAVLESFAEEGSETCFVDALDLQSPRTKSFVTETYLSLIQNRPGVWSFLYDNERIVPLVEVFRRIFVREARAAYLRVIREFRPDLLLATQAIPSGILAHMKARGEITQPLVVCATDFGSHPYWAYEGIDARCVATPDAAERIAAQGAPRASIHETGIPVPREIRRAAEDPAAARARAEAAWGIRPGEKVALLAGGGRGLGITPEHLAAVEEAGAGTRAGATTVVALAGSSLSLAGRLEALPRRAGVRRIVAGLVPDIASLYARADLVVTKPGGLTLAEVLAIGRPLALVSPLPGQEVQNLDALVTQRKEPVALSARAPAELGEIARRVLDDPAQGAEIAARARAAGRPAAAEAVRRVASGVLARAERTQASQDARRAS